MKGGIINRMGLVANVISIGMQWVVFWVPEHPFSGEVKLMVIVFDMMIYVLLVLSERGFEHQILYWIFRKYLLYRSGDVWVSMVQGSVLYYGYMGIVKEIQMIQIVMLIISVLVCIYQCSYVWCVGYIGLVLIMKKIGSMVDEYNKRLVWLMTTLVFVICKVSMETIILNMVGVVLTVYRFKGIQSNRNRKYYYIAYLVVISLAQYSMIVMINMIMSIGLLAQTGGKGRNWRIIFYGQTQMSTGLGEYAYMRQNKIILKIVLLINHYICMYMYLMATTLSYEQCGLWIINTAIIMVNHQHIGLNIREPLRITIIISLLSQILTYPISIQDAVYNEVMGCDSMVMNVLLVVQMVEGIMMALAYNELRYMIVLTNVVLLVWMQCVRDWVIPFISLVYMMV